MFYHLINYIEPDKIFADCTYLRSPSSRYDCRWKLECIVATERKCVSSPLVTVRSVGRADMAHNFVIASNDLRT